MLRQIPKAKVITAVAIVVALGGAAVLTLAPHHSSPLAALTHPAVTPAPSVSPSTPGGSSAPGTAGTSEVISSPAPGRPGAVSQAAPAVAGAATQAPSASKALAPKSVAGAAPPTPPAATVTLTLKSPAGTSDYSVRLNAGADACTILNQAKAEGKITSLTILDTPEYRQKYHSAYVREINGYENSWTVKVNGAAPLGCSLVALKQNDNVTWRYQ